jgi:glycosyltransferase involved in cell wall biosynthesis
LEGAFRNAMTDRILVFIPCYNCERQIGRVLRQFRDVPRNTFEEILVLDNNSQDGTVRAAIDALPTIADTHVVVARNRENYNLGGSHKATFAYAESRAFTHVVVLHGDDQGRIGDVLPLLASGAHRVHDACLGARFMAGSSIEGYSTFRRIGNRIFNLIFQMVLRRRVFDLGSGLNVFGRAVFAREVTTRLPDDLYFNPYLLVTLADRGMRIAFFPISWREDDQVSNVRMASQALRTLGAAREYAADRRFLRTGEHRRVPRDEYVFDVIAQHEPASPRLA